MDYGGYPTIFLSMGELPVPVVVGVVGMFRLFRSWFLLERQRGTNNLLRQAARADCQLLIAVLAVLCAERLVPPLFMHLSPLLRLCTGSVPSTTSCASRLIPKRFGLGCGVINDAKHLQLRVLIVSAAMAGITLKRARH